MLSLFHQISTGRKGLQGTESLWGIRTSREVVGRFLHTGDTLVKASIATEFGVENTVLEAGWILKVEVDLAVQAFRGDRNSGAN